jgi:hypothetical protein
MRKIIAAVSACLILPTMVAAQTYPTNRNRNDGAAINGDINGDISGTSAPKKQYYYKRNLPNRPGCQRNRAGNYICK